MKITSSEELFERLLSLSHSGERQMLESLPELAKAADNPELIYGLRHHEEETQVQLERVEKAAASVEGLTLRRIKDHVMEALIEDGQSFVDGIAKGPLRDAAIIGAAQKVEHYEIAAYGTLCALADQLGYTEAKKLLNETLEEEKSTDKTLSAVALEQVNPEA